MVQLQNEAYKTVQ